MPKRLRTPLLDIGKGEEWRISTPRILSNASIPISIGSSLWIALRSDRGLVEFLPDSNSFGPDIEYPEEFKNQHLYAKTISCKYKAESIIVIIPIGHFGVVFDTKTRQFSDVFRWESKEESESGGWLSCIAIGDYLHIDTVGVSGKGYDIGDYIIYSMIDKTTRKIEVGVTGKPLISTIIKSSDFNQSNKILISGFARKGSPRHIPVEIVSIIIQFYHHKKLFKFGGRRRRPEQFIDSFYIGTLNKGDPAEPIEWKLTPQYTLPHPMKGFGCIHHEHFIVIFGGRIQDSQCCNKRYDS